MQLLLRALRLILGMTADGWQHRISCSALGMRAGWSGFVVCMLLSHTSAESRAAENLL
jgi:hypothetical protein